MVENLLNKKFNYLTVIDGPTIKKKHTYWLCKCDCGTVKEIRSDRLKDNTTVSCGCKKQKNLKYMGKNLTNQHFGLLIALKDSNKRTNDGRIIWECLCECGNICYVSSHSLLNGNTISCGCLKSKGENKIADLLRQANIPFEQQKTFPTCKFPDTNYLAKFDFFVDDTYLIEYDGEQHFYYKNSSHTWNTKENYKKVIEHDNYKTQWCKENNIPLIRIPYTKLNVLTIDDLRIVL